MGLPENIGEEAGPGEGEAGLLRPRSTCGPALAGREAVVPAAV